MHYLPCGIHRNHRETEAARTANFHRHGLARLVYFNPLICTDYEPVYSRAADAGALQRLPHRRPLYIPRLRRRRRPGRVHLQAAGPVRLHERRRPPDLPLAAAGGGRGGSRRLDGGLRRVHAADRGVGRRNPGAADAQPLSDDLPLRGPRLPGRPPPPPPAGPAARALLPLGLDGHGALRRQRLGRRPDHGLGLRRPRLGGDAGAGHGRVGRSRAGARTSAGTTRSGPIRSSTPSCSCAGSSSALSPRDADEGERPRAAAL